MDNFVSENSNTPPPAQFQGRQFGLVQELMVYCIIIFLH